MKLLVLDPRNGDSYADLFVVDPKRETADQIRLGYVPELQFDSVAGELLVVETELDSRVKGGGHYWLDGYTSDTLERKWRVETPPRPMYAGFPGRSTRVQSTPGGKYIYVLECGLPPDRDDVYRITPHRYDRDSGTLEKGRHAIDSCMIEFGQFGAGDDELFFHLTCDFPSTLVLSRFSEPEIEWIRMDNLPPRTHSPRETCGSWFDRASGWLYCITMDGAIYRVNPAQRSSAVWAQLPIEEPRSVPLQQLYCAGGAVFAGVSITSQERSLGLASEIWRLSAADGTIEQVLRLPFGVMNFVVEAGGRTLYAVTPYGKALCIVDAVSGGLMGLVADLGWTPGEIQLLC